MGAMYYIGLNLAYMWYLDSNRATLEFSMVSKIVLMTIVLVVQPVCIALVQPTWLGLIIYTIFLYTSWPFTQKREPLASELKAAREAKKEK